MIKVNVKKEIITISGHANYDKYGNDIVCAAVSACVLTSINAILSIDSSYLNVSEGETLIINVLKHDEIVDTILLNMVNMLEELKLDYKKNIDIIKEV